MNIAKLEEVRDRFFVELDNSDLNKVQEALKNIERCERLLHVYRTQEAFKGAREALDGIKKDEEKLN